MARKKGNGLDVCGICGDNLSLDELYHYIENEGACDICIAMIQWAKDEIDENIKKRRK